MSYFSRLFACLCAFFIFSFSANSQNWEFQTQARVGAEPTSIYYYGDKGDTLLFDVFCNGLDANFNGVKDSGDICPSWYRLYFTKTNLVCSQQIMEMSFTSLPWPFRPAILEDTNGDKIPLKLLFFAEKDTLKILDLTNKRVLDNSLYYKSGISAISGDGNMLYISVRNSGTDSIIAFNWKTKQESFRLPAFENIQQTRLIQNSANDTLLVALNEGSYGAPDSKITIYNFKAQATTIDTFPLGSGGNSFTIVGDYCFAVSNGSHKIVKIDLLNKKLIDTFSTKTDGYDGPREIIASANTNMKDKLYFTTYSNKIKIMRASDGLIEDSLDAKGKAEGIVQVGPWLLAAIPFKSEGFYDPENKITIYYQNTLYVNEISPATIKTFPNPSVDYITFAFGENNSKQIDIYNAQGEKIISMSSNNENVKIDANFPAGAYYAIIQSNGKSSRANFIKI